MITVLMTRVCEDDIIPTCFDMDNEHWQEEFLSQLGEGPSTMQPSADNTDNPEDSQLSYSYRYV